MAHLAALTEPYPTVIRKQRKSEIGRMLLMCRLYKITMPSIFLGPMYNFNFLKYKIYTINHVELKQNKDSLAEM